MLQRNAHIKTKRDAAESKAKEEKLAKNAHGERNQRRLRRRK